MGVGYWYRVTTMSNNFENKYYYDFKKAIKVECEHVCHLSHR